MKLIFVILSLCCVIFGVRGSDSACLEPLQVGPCRAMMPKFYYNPDAKECQQFYYGGCQGNQNNFKTKEECETACKQ